MGSIFAKDFINDQIAIPYQDMLPAKLRLAYDAVKALVPKADFLESPSAAFARGHLVAWAVEFQVFKLIRDGHWPFDCEWVGYAKPTGVYLRIDTGRAFVTVNQLGDASEGPRFAVHRLNAGLANYPLLPFDVFERESEDNAKKHLVIGHGYQDLSFVIIGVPKPRSKVWIDKTENLLNRQPPLSRGAENDPIQPTLPGVPEEATDVEIDLELNEHLRKRLRDNHG